MPPFPPSALLPAHIRFGRGRATDLPALCRGLGPRGLLVHGGSLRRAAALPDLLTPMAGSCQAWECPPGEPTLETVDRLRAALRTHHADWLAAVGGGSVLDTAKAAAGLAGEDAPTAAFHAGRPVHAPGLPWIAVPTTAGTGAEVTPNAVLTDSATALKKSIRADSFLARTVVLDSALLAGAPPAVIAAAGMDALTQAAEAYASRQANAWSDAMALAAVALLVPALPAVFRDSTQPEAADNLLAGSTLAGLALAQARLGVVHGLAHPLGAFYRQPHGLVCAACLPLALTFNRSAMGGKYDRLSAAAGGDIHATSEDLLHILSLANPFRGQPLARQAEIVEQTLASGSTAANPRPVTPADVEWFLAHLFNP